MEQMDGSTFSINFFSVVRSFSSLSEDFNVGSCSSIPNTSIERSEIEFSRSFGVTAGGSGGRGLGFDSSTLMFSTSDEDELTTDFISVNSRLISLMDVKFFFSSSTLSRNFRTSSTLGDDRESASLAGHSQDSQSQTNP